jgi:hypothetical protein
VRFIAPICNLACDPACAHQYIINPNIRWAITGPGEQPFVAGTNVEADLFNKRASVVKEKSAASGACHLVPPHYLDKKTIVL